MEPIDLTRRTALLAAAGLTAIPIAAQVDPAQAVARPGKPETLSGNTARRTPYDYGADIKAPPTANQQKAVQAMLDDCAASWHPLSGRFARLPDPARRPHHRRLGRRRTCPPPPHRRGFELPAAGRGPIGRRAWQTRARDLICTPAMRHQAFA